MWYQEDVAKPEFRIEYHVRAGISAEAQEQHQLRAMRIRVEYISNVTNGVKVFDQVTRAWSKDITTVHDFITIPDNDVRVIRKIELTIGRGTVFEKFIDHTTGKESSIVISCPQCRLHWTTGETNKTEFVITGRWRARKSRGWYWWLIVIVVTLALLSVSTTLLNLNVV